MNEADEEFDAFYRAHFGRLAGALRLVCGDVATAEELAQEAMVRAYVAWDRVAVLERPAGWLYTTAFNLTRRRWRERSRTPPSDVSQIEGPGDRATVRLMLEAALADLPGPQRNAVVLRYVLGFTTNEAAHILGTTPGALRALLHRAVVALRLQPAFTNTEEGD